MPSTRLLGIDIGQKRTGVAVSDEMRLFASPLTVIEAPHKESLVNKIVEIINEYDVCGVVVGLPLDQNGERGRDAEKTGQVVSLLQNRSPVPVIEWDERYSTVEAERILIGADVSRKKRKGVIDKVAAAVILQSYLDSLKSETENP